MWSKESFLLAMIGGVGYCLTAYTAFHYAPAAHAAVFLNGCIPLCTALAAFVLFKQGFDRHTWISMAIMLLAIGSMSWLMFRESGVALGLGDLLFSLVRCGGGVHRTVTSMETVCLAFYGQCGDLVSHRLCANLSNILPQTSGCC